MTENEFVLLASKEEEISEKSLVYVASKAEWDDPNTIVIPLYFTQEKGGEKVPMKYLLHDEVQHPSGNAEEKFIFHFPNWYKVIGPVFIPAGNKHKTGLVELKSNSQ